MFEHWTPQGHIFSIIISLMFAGYVSKGNVVSTLGIAVACYFAMGLLG
jgi:hypothetical protein